MTRRRSLAPISQPPAPGFTLFELIVAIALSATLLMLLGTAINLYLLRVDAGRTRVEEAQLARSILAMIAADVRSTTVYQTQDISSATQLANSASTFNVDSIDKNLPKSSGSGGSGSSGSGSSGPSSQGVTERTTAKGAAAPGPTAPTSGSSAGTGASGGGGGNSGGNSPGNSNSNDQNTDTMQPGLNGTLEEMIIDVNHLPRLDELFPTNTQTTATTTSAAANTQRPSDVKTIRYFVRQGDAIDPSDVAATSLAPDSQACAGGLVRQTIDRAVRATAEQSGNSAVLDSGQVLVAPEVVAVEFRYFDGTGAVEEWNMQQAGSLPQAVEVRIWITSSDSPAAGTMIRPGSTDALSGSHMYSQTIDLPLAQAAGSNSSGANDNTGSGTEGFGSGASGTSSTGTGSGGTSTQ